MGSLRVWPPPINTFPCSTASEKSSIAIIEMGDLKCGVCVRVCVRVCVCLCVIESVEHEICVC